MSRDAVALPLAWLAALLFAIGAWLHLGAPSGGREAPLRVALVDVSASAVGGDARFAASMARTLHERAQRAATDGEEFVAIAYGRGARTFEFDTASSSEEIERGLASLGFGRGEDATDLAAGFELAARIADERRISILEVIGDGTFTGVDPSPFAARLAARGVRIEVANSPSPRDPDVGVAPLASPLRVRRGEPVRVEVEVWDGRLAEDADLVVTATLMDGEHTRTQSVTLGPPPQDGVRNLRTVRVAFDLPPLDGARAALEVRADLVANGVRRVSAWPENDATTAEVLAEGTLRVGVVGTVAARRAFLRALGDAPRDLAIVEMETIPADSRAAFDVLATIDAPLGRADAEFLDAWVAAGRGWIDLAGATRSGSARVAAAALVPAENDERPREIALLLDGSGSMSGAPAANARAALIHLVEHAPASDGLTAIWFSDERAPAIDLGRPGERETAARRRDIVARVASAPEPRGPTRIWRALDELAEGIDARLRTLAILISDGRDPDRADFAARAAELRARLAAQGADLAVIAVGDDPDRELLGALAGSATELFEAGDLSRADGAERLARLFARAIANGPVFDVIPPRPARFAGSSEPLALPFAAFGPPVMSRFLVAWASERASVVWTSDAASGSIPLFALARRGLGLAGTFAFAPDPTWLAAPNDLGAVLATGVRAVAPPSDGTELALFEREGDLVLRGALESEPAVIHVELLAADSDARLGSVDLLAGDEPARERSARLPSVLAELDRGESIRARITGLVDASQPRELAFRAPRAPEFARLPSAFVAPKTPAKVPQSALPAHGSGDRSPAATWALTAGALAWVVAVLLGFFSRNRR